ncbi:MAG: acyl-CoA dehydrogenase family protein [Bdellovibrionales bacterium]|nr:acyl-CoA dehydrogenase family protein [Bdellovibrionales bacterium]
MQFVQEPTPDPSRPQSADPHDEGIIEKTARAFDTNIDEALKLGQIDRADRGVEATFEKGRRTEDSPSNQSIWNRGSAAQFASSELVLAPEIAQRIQDCVDCVRRHHVAGTNLDGNGKISSELLSELGTFGYWGMLIPREHGGVGLRFREFAHLITEMAKVDPTVAGLASVHGCIGAVDPLVTFGSDALKEKYLPRLASGERLSAFALTEKGAGSDLTAIQTTATRDGDDFVINGEKLFITNAGPGRTIGLVAMLDGKQAVFIVDLPDQENEHFQVKRYDIYALRHANNVGLKFTDLRIPKENLLQVTGPDGELRADRGLVIAYHGLNRGRIALCANAAGAMRQLLSSTLPWAEFRTTYDKPIAERELVQRRIGKMAARIAAADALTAWTADLLDNGYRGEAECIIAKIFGSEAQKEAAIELALKTHGGRSFLKGHLVGDNIHDYLAPCIYEGEGEMLSMAFFKALTKEHGEKFFLPIAEKVNELREAGKMKYFVPSNPMHAWWMRGPMSAYGGWVAKRTLSLGVRKLASALGSGRDGVEDLPRELGKLVSFALQGLERMSLEISGSMVKHQAGLPDRQCRMIAISQKAQDLMTIAVTALWGAQQESPLQQQAALAMCEELTMKMNGKLHSPSDASLKRLTRLGKQVIEDASVFTRGTPTPEILQQYQRKGGEA